MQTFEEELAWVRRPMLLGQEPWRITLARPAYIAMFLLLPLLQKLAPRLVGGQCNAPRTAWLCGGRQAWVQAALTAQPTGCRHHHHHHLLLRHGSSQADCIRLLLGRRRCGAACSRP
jgi:hypothetical protein